MQRSSAAVYLRARGNTVIGGAHTQREREREREREKGVYLLWKGGAPSAPRDIAWVARLPLSPQKKLTVSAQH